ncbi:hypothetical protein C8Q77DRAFT_217119 [Trametes polyzona]|nr:hypothetical protein C8Q77DRAFT_217119 [Trametes polyzona]
MPEMNLGALLVGCVVQAIFYGDLFSLPWRYDTRGRGGDPWSFIVCINRHRMLLCTFSVAITAHGLWFFVIESFSRQDLNAPWTVDNVEAYLQNSHIFAGVQSPPWCSCSRSSSVIRTSLAPSPSQSDYSDVRRNSGPDLKPLFYLIFATGLCADALLTGMMCLCLHNARTGFHRTDPIINRMIVDAIQSGLFPSLVETGGMIAFIAVPQTQIYIAFYIQIGVLYLCSLLTSLNTRQYVHRRTSQPISLNFSMLNSGVGTLEPIMHRGSSMVDPLTSSSADVNPPGEQVDVVESEKVVMPDSERPADWEQASRVR